MIRVLQYIGSLAQGGSQAMIMNLYRNIDKTQIQFDFVIHADGLTPLAKEVILYGANIFTCPRYSLRTVGKYSAWWQAFFKEHSDYKIVHSHVRSTAAIVLKIAKANGCKTIVHSHSTSSGSGISSIIKSILQYRIRFVADYYIGCSQVAGEWLFGKKICSSDRYFNLRNAIDTEKYVYNSKLAKSVRESLGFKESDIIIGHVGRFSKPKNHSFLIDLFYELHKKDGQYKLLLVGDGELKESIETKVGAYGLERDVAFTGVRSDVNELLMAMDLFLFPSLWEGLPVSVVEAQASGLPCVISSSITDEVCITDLVSQIELSATVDDWINLIYKKVGACRTDTMQAVAKSGYDIHDSCQWITAFYKEIYNS